jgi:gliding motility-associated-like protein
MKVKIVLLNLFFIPFGYQSQVVINEVMHKPATSSSVNQGFTKKEYVEIFNSSCSPVDISCWIIGSSAPLTGTTPYWVGAYQFSAGTIIAPGQHLVLGGTNSDNGTAYNTADIDFNVNVPGNSCVTGTGGWLLPNGDGWVALYNNSGVVQDAVYWSLSANPNLNTDADFSTNPCVPSTGCAPVASLMSCRQINQNYPSRLSYGGLSTSFDLTFSRVPDGGAWQRDIPSSITGNQCNNGQCATISSFTLSAATVQPSCGQSNGSITITPSPAGTYTYAWTPNSSTTGIATGLSAGTYTVTATNASGCQSSITVPLTSSGGISAIAVNTVNPTCGGSNGSVTLGSVTGGTAPYQYNFNGTGLGSNTSFTNLSSGTYTLTVQDAGGCIYSAPDVVVNNGNGPTAVVVTVSPENCNLGNGSVTIGTVTGGTAPYLYDFSGLGYSGTSSYQNLPSGNYSLTIQDASNCLFNAPVIVVSEISGPTAIQVTTNNATCGNANGSVVLGAVTGGTAPYQYNFNNSGYSNTTNYSNLNTGSYTVSVQDSAGCIYTAANAVITNTTSPTGITQTINDASCGLQNGSVVLGSVTGGTAPYQYNFNGQGYSSNTTFSGLNGSSYSLIVQDALGCTYAAPAIVLSTSVGPTIINFNSVNASCDQNNGSIQIVSITGGTAPYQYSFNGSALTTTTSYPNLVPGAYQLSVLDASGCTIQTQVQISGGSSPIADFAINPSAISIYDPYANLINLSSSDVVLNSWSIPNGEPNSSNSEDLQISFLDSEPGTYPITLIVTNADGCTDTVVKTIEVFAEIIVFAPNSFTPDGDEYNNDWKIYVSNADLTSFKLQIYNRWGELVFESFDSEVGWDGTYNGVYVQDGTYSWTLTIKDLRNDNYYKYLGHINKIQ